MPVQGVLTQLSDVSDQIFASKALGDGFVVKPTANKIYSPISGTVDSVFDTKHAITIKNKDGINVLLHMGVDTVELNGVPFTIHVVAGNRIKAGDLLAEVDLGYLSEQGKSDEIITVFPDLSDKATINIEGYGSTFDESKAIGSISLTSL
ncbi:PTS sugar transporter subunit IIA [Lactiplantibacillus plantarum]|uniref:PTS sugar transporter subunit IIA n=1 Tax=Lactiplantibacillus plantarum TaxID=1590 RepID=UPI0013625674|nr:PTS glucose transporter subunit IIA [Lactiplantibacillus plantarum]QHM51197.1 PTS system glucose-specific EIICBA component [Lactiplantibacillus plantarum]